MRRSSGWAIGLTALVVLAAALPSLATAATIEVREPEGQAILAFDGAGSEANQVTLTEAAFATDVVSTTAGTATATVA